MSDRTARVMATEGAHELPPGCHSTITSHLFLAANVPTEAPAAALPFLLGLPGVVQVGSMNPEPPAPQAPVAEED